MADDVKRIVSFGWVREETRVLDGKEKRDRRGDDGRSGVGDI